MTALLRSTLDGYPGTIHVHFPVADLVEPCPCKERLARWGIWWNGKCIAACQRATAFDGFDDREPLFVVGQGQLA